MVSFDEYRQWALEFPGALQAPHFDLISFRTKKRIFGTYWPRPNRAMLKLPLPEQSVFCEMDPAIFFPVPNAWGKQGATFVELKKVKKTVFKEALKIAYQLSLAK